MALDDAGFNAGALFRLRSEAAHLTPALKRLADAILAEPRNTVYNTVTELAEIAQVGEASVIRLCRDLGFKGFQDFKLALAADLAVASDIEETGDPETLGDILEFAARQARQALDETRTLLDMGVLEGAVAALSEAESVLIYGAGASSVTARDFAYKLLRLGLFVTVHDDAHLAAMTAATLAPGAVFIGITRSGSTIDTVRVLELANARGVPTLLVTQRAKSPAVPLADYVLYTANSESPLTGGSIPTKMGQLLLLDTLFTALLLRKQGARESVAKTARAVSDRNY